MSKSPRPSGLQVMGIQTKGLALNDRIRDRSNVFYWQTDRNITLGEAKAIWVDRHKNFSDKEIIEKANAALKGKKLGWIKPFDPDSQTSLGSVNHVRIGRLSSGKEVVIRCHPKGVANGYFHAESLASGKARSAGLASYKTYAVHELENKTDFAFQVIEKMPGTAISKWLQKNPAQEGKMLFEIGRTMAALHKIRVSGFGPFDNETAKKGSLAGIHKTYASAIHAGLAFNLGVLREHKIFDKIQAGKIIRLFADSNPMLECSAPVLVHNDFADWNLLTDGKRITGILDWDECVGGDPVSDIACWSTFFRPERLDGMLDGYWSAAPKPSHFEERFQLLRFRYTISKMTLRIRRYTYEHTEDIRLRIEYGRKHLSASMDYLGLS